MFVYYFAEVEGDHEAVVSAVLASLPELPQIAADAYRRGEQMRTHRRPDGHHRGARAVRFRLGAAAGSSGETTIPFVWEASGSPGLFPRMEGDLVLTDLGSGVTHVALRGSYGPVLPRWGHAFDRAVLHRLAEVAARHVVDELVALARTRLEPAPVALR